MGLAEMKPGESMSEELKLCPCFFCGKSVYPFHSGTWKGLFTNCPACSHTYEINPSKWNNAWAHKRIAELEREVTGLKHSRDRWMSYSKSWEAQARGTNTLEQFIADRKDDPGFKIMKAKERP